MCVQDKYWEVGKAIMTTFRDYGYRYNPRTKCRLMYLINDMGMEVFFSQKAPFPLFKSPVFSGFTEWTYKSIDFPEPV